MVPKGAYMQTHTGAVVRNDSFHGLSTAEASNLEYYLHFTPRASSTSATASSVSSSTDRVYSQNNKVLCKILCRTFTSSSSTKTPLTMINHQVRTYMLHFYWIFMHACMCSGCWSVVWEQGGRTVLLRNLFWPGQVAYHVPHTSIFGHFYCGTGERTTDLLFML